MIVKLIRCNRKIVESLICDLLFRKYWLNAAKN